jgi:hypothetical protein
MTIEKANSKQPGARPEPWNQNAPLHALIIISQVPTLSGMGGVPVERQRPAQTRFEMLENEGPTLARKRLAEQRERLAEASGQLYLVPNDSRFASLCAAGLNGPGQPNSLAIRRAAMCLKTAKAMCIDVPYLTTSAVGGVALTFANGPKIAMLECDNDGDIVAMMSDRSLDQDAETWILGSNFDTSIQDALHRLHAFVCEKTGAA